MVKKCLEEERDVPMAEEENENDHEWVLCYEVLFVWQRK
jgi:hypothetical protein